MDSPAPYPRQGDERERRKHEAAGGEGGPRGEREQGPRASGGLYTVPSGTDPFRGAGADMDGVVGVKADTEDLRGIGRHMSATRCRHPAKPATASVPGMSGWISVNTRRDRRH